MDNHYPTDLIKLRVVSNDQILETLKYRFQRDKIYTHVGPILVALNPFKWIKDLYSESLMEAYMSGKYDNDMSSHPHVFGIAYDTYSSLCEDELDQSILVSGESGSGKTETTKQCLNYLAFATSRMTTSSDAPLNSITDKILKAGIILEAFGNAKTIRNNNSSRFGKFIEIWFTGEAITTQGDSKNVKTPKLILGSSNTTYLLEKTRVIHQDPQERNFHVFYQLICGASPSLSQELLFGSTRSSTEQFSILNQSGCSRIPGVDDARDFMSLDTTFNSLGFTSDEKSYIYRTLGACLHLGNVNFEAIPNHADDECQLYQASNNIESFCNASRLIGVNQDSLEKALLFKVVQTGGFNKKNSSIVHAPYQLETVYEMRNAVIKELYSQCFDFIVAKINERINNQESLGSMPSQSGGNRMIGILDIFGFEIFKKNSFEQLCINLANECLQQNFNTNIFRAEIALYQSEGIPVPPLDFKDNQDVLDLLTKRPTGLLHILDEEGNIPKGSPSGYLSKIVKQHDGKHVRFRSKPLVKGFAVVHYAGEVTYDPSLFLLKNKDNFPSNIYEVLASSSISHFKKVFPMQTNSSSMGSGNKLSIGKTFAQQLDSLISRIETTKPRYIRCIKTNEEKLPNNFNSQVTFEQLNYSGIFEAVIIMQSGYPFRLSHDKFYDRNFMLIGKGYRSSRQFLDDKKNQNWKKICSEIVSGIIPRIRLFNAQQSSTEMPLDAAIISDGCHLGQSMLFYRADQNYIIRLIRSDLLSRAVITIQSSARCSIYSRHYQIIRMQSKVAMSIIKVAIAKGGQNVSTVESDTLTSCKEDMKSAVQKMNKCLHRQAFKDYSAAFESVIKAIDAERSLTPKISQLLSETNGSNLLEKYPSLAKVMEEFKTKVLYNCSLFTSVNKLSYNWERNPILASASIKVHRFGLVVSMKQQLQAALAAEEELRLKKLLDEMYSLINDGLMERNYCKIEEEAACKMITASQNYFDDFISFIGPAIKEGPISVHRLVKTDPVEISVKASVLSQAIHKWTSTKFNTTSSIRNAKSQRIDYILEFLGQIVKLRTFAERKEWQNLWNLMHEPIWTRKGADLNSDNAIINDIFGSLKYYKLLGAGDISKINPFYAHRLCSKFIETFPADLVSHLDSELDAVRTIVIEKYLIQSMQQYLVDGPIPEVPSGDIEFHCPEIQAILNQINDKYATTVDGDGAESHQNEYVKFVLQSAVEQVKIREALNTDSSSALRKTLDSLKYIGKSHIDYVNAQKLLTMMSIKGDLRDALINDGPIRLLNPGSSDWSKLSIDKLGTCVSVLKSLDISDVDWIRPLNACSVISSIRSLILESNYAAAVLYITNLLNQSPWSVCAGSSDIKMVMAIVAPKSNNDSSSSIIGLAVAEFAHYKFEIPHRIAMNSFRIALQSGHIRLIQSNKSDLSTSTTMTVSLSDIDAEALANVVNSHSKNVIASTNEAYSSTDSGDVSSSELCFVANSYFLQDCQDLVAMRRFAKMKQWNSIKPIIDRIRVRSLNINKPSFSDCHDWIKIEMILIYDEMFDVVELRQNFLASISPVKSFDEIQRSIKLLETALSIGFPLEQRASGSSRVMSADTGTLFSSVKFMYAIRSAIVENRWELTKPTSGMVSGNAAAESDYIVDTDSKSIEEYIKDFQILVSRKGRIKYADDLLSMLEKMHSPHYLRHNRISKMFLRSSATLSNNTSRNSFSTVGVKALKEQQSEGVVTLEEFKAQCHLFAVYDLIFYYDADLFIPTLSTISNIAKPLPGSVSVGIALKDARSISAVLHESCIQEIQLLSRIIVDRQCSSAFAIAMTAGDIKEVRSPLGDSSFDLDVRYCSANIVTRALDYAQRFQQHSLPPNRESRDKANIWHSACELILFSRQSLPTYKTTITRAEHNKWMHGIKFDDLKKILVQLRALTNQNNATKSALHVASYFEILQNNSYSFPLQEIELLTQKYEDAVEIKRILHQFSLCKPVLAEATIDGTQSIQPNELSILNVYEFKKLENQICEKAELDTKSIEGKVGRSECMKETLVLIELSLDLIKSAVTGKWTPSDVANWRIVRKHRRTEKGIAEKKSREKIELNLAKKKAKLEGISSVASMRRMAYDSSSSDESGDENQRTTGGRRGFIRGDASSSDSDDNALTASRSTRTAITSTEVEITGSNISELPHDDLFPDDSDDFDDEVLDVNTLLSMFDAYCLHLENDCNLSVLKLPVPSMREVTMLIAHEHRRLSLIRSVVDVFRACDYLPAGNIVIDGDVNFEQQQQQQHPCLLHLTLGDIQTESLMSLIQDMESWVRDSGREPDIVIGHLLGTATELLQLRREMQSIHFKYYRPFTEDDQIKTSKSGYRFEELGIQYDDFNDVFEKLDIDGIIRKTVFIIKKEVCPVVGDRSSILSNRSKSILNGTQASRNKKGLLMEWNFIDDLLNNLKYIPLQPELRREIGVIRSESAGRRFISRGLDVFDEINSLEADQSTISSTPGTNAGLTAMLPAILDGYRGIKQRIESALNGLEDDLKVANCALVSSGSSDSSIISLSPQVDPTSNSSLVPVMLGPAIEAIHRALIFVYHFIDIRLMKRYATFDRNWRKNLMLKPLLIRDLRSAIGTNTISAVGATIKTSPSLVTMQELIRFADDAFAALPQPFGFSYLMRGYSHGIEDHITVLELTDGLNTGMAMGSLDRLSVSKISSIQLDSALQRVSHLPIHKSFQTNADINLLVSTCDIISKLRKGISKGKYEVAFDALREYLSPDEVPDRLLKSNESTSDRLQALLLITNKFKANSIDFTLVHKQGWKEFSLLAAVTMDGYWRFIVQEIMQFGQIRISEIESLTPDRKVNKNLLTNRPNSVNIVHGNSNLRSYWTVFGGYDSANEYFQKWDFAEQALSALKELPNWRAESHSIRAISVLVLHLRRSMFALESLYHNYLVTQTNNWKSRVALENGLDVRVDGMTLIDNRDWQQQLELVKQDVAKLQATLFDDNPTNSKSSGVSNFIGDDKSLLYHCQKQGFEEANYIEARLAYLKAIEDFEVVVRGGFMIKISSQGLSVEVESTKVWDNMVASLRSVIGLPVSVPGSLKRGLAILQEYVESESDAMRQWVIVVVLYLQNCSRLAKFIMRSKSSSTATSTILIDINPENVDDLWLSLGQCEKHWITLHEISHSYSPLIKGGIYVPDFLDSLNRHLVSIRVEVYNFKLLLNITRKNAIEICCVSSRDDSTALDIGDDVTAKVECNRNILPYPESPVSSTWHSLSIYDLSIDPSSILSSVDYFTKLQSVLGGHKDPTISFVCNRTKFLHEIAIMELELRLAVLRANWLSINEMIPKILEKDSYGDRSAAIDIVQLFLDLKLASRRLENILLASSLPCVCGWSQWTSGNNGTLAGSIVQQRRQSEALLQQTIAIAVDQHANLMPYVVFSSLVFIGQYFLATLEAIRDGLWSGDDAHASFIRSTNVESAITVNEHVARLADALLSKRLALHPAVRSAMNCNIRNLRDEMRFRDLNVKCFAYFQMSKLSATISAEFDILDPTTGDQIYDLQTSRDSKYALFELCQLIKLESRLLQRSWDISRAYQTAHLLYAIYMSLDHKSLQNLCDHIQLLSHSAGAFDLWQANGESHRSDSIVHIDLCSESETLSRDDSQWTLFLGRFVNSLETRSSPEYQANWKEATSIKEDSIAQLIQTFIHAIYETQDTRMVSRVTDPDFSQSSGQNLALLGGQASLLKIRDEAITDLFLLEKHVVLEKLLETFELLIVGHLDARVFDFFHTQIDSTAKVSVTEQTELDDYMELSSHFSGEQRYQTSSQILISIFKAKYLYHQCDRLDDLLSPSQEFNRNHFDASSGQVTPAKILGASHFSRIYQAIPVVYTIMKGIFHQQEDLMCSIASLAQINGVFEERYNDMIRRKLSESKKKSKPKRDIIYDLEEDDDQLGIDFVRGKTKRDVLVVTPGKKSVSKLQQFEAFIRNPESQLHNSKADNEVSPIYNQGTSPSHTIDQYSVAGSATIMSEVYRTEIETLEAEISRKFNNLFQLENSGEATNEKDEEEILSDVSEDDLYDDLYDGIPAEDLYDMQDTEFDRVSTRGSNLGRTVRHLAATSSSSPRVRSGKESSQPILNAVFNPSERAAKKKLILNTSKYTNEADPDHHRQRHRHKKRNDGSSLVHSTSNSSGFLSSITSSIPIYHARIPTMLRSNASMKEARRVIKSPGKVVVPSYTESLFAGDSSFINANRESQNVNPVRNAITVTRSKWDHSRGVGISELDDGNNLPYPLPSNNFSPSFFRNPTTSIREKFATLTNPNSPAARTPPPPPSPSSDGIRSPYNITAALYSAPPYNNKTISRTVKKFSRDP